MSRRSSAVTSFLDWAVGPVTPVRAGAVFGFVLGAALPLLWKAIRGLEIGNLYPMYAIFAGGPVGSLVGALVGLCIKPSTRSASAGAQEGPAAENDRRAEHVGDGGKREE